MWLQVKITDDMLDWQAGCAWAWIVKIRPKYRDDAGLLAHELVHVRQWWRLLILHPILYAWSKRYRLRCEVEAYREQLTYCSANRDLFGYSIASRYGLEITAEEAAKLL